MMDNEQIDGNKEMVAIGLMNVVGSLTSCYLSTGNYFLYFINQIKYFNLNSCIQIVIGFSNISNS